MSVERAGLAWPEGTTRAAFEFEDRDAFREYQGQPTSIDLVIGRQGETPGIFIESKFVEKEFGGCSLFEKGDCDARSPTFAYQDRNTNRGLVPFLLSLTPGRLHAKIKVVYIQEVVAAIRESGRHEWIGEFERKYGLG